MKMPNFSEWGLVELIEGKKIIGLMIQDKEDQEKALLLQEFQDKAEAMGFNFNQLVGINKKKKSLGGKVLPKYRNPMDADLAWTGRGKKPIWVNNHLAAGGTMEELLINPG